MAIQTGLLITEDVDDLIYLSEAVDEITDSVVLVHIQTTKKAHLLLQSKIFIPTVIFLDLSMENLNIDQLCGLLEKDRDLRKIELIVYGDGNELVKVGKNRISNFFDTTLGFNELRDFLRTVL